MFSGNECTVPVISDASSVEIGVYAGNLCTTTPAVIGCKKSILCKNGLPQQEPPSDVYTQLLEKIDSFNYEPILINSFSINESRYVKGSTASGITLSWEINMLPELLRIYRKDEQSGIKKIQLEANALPGFDKFTFPISESYTSDTTWILEVTDIIGNTASKEVRLSFVNDVYFGISTATAFSDALLSSLNKSSKGPRSFSFSGSAGTGAYAYYCIPASYDVHVFTINDVVSDFDIIDTFSQTNSAGYTELYNVYRSSELLLGQMRAEVYYLRKNIEVQ